MWIINNVTFYVLDCITLSHNKDALNQHRELTDGKASRMHAYARKGSTKAGFGVSTMPKQKLPDASYLR